MTTPRRKPNREANGRSSRTAARGAPDSGSRRPLEPDDTVATRSWRAIVWVNGLLRRLCEPHLAKYGFSPAQWGILRTLSRLEAQGLGEPRMNELGEQLLVQPPSLSATIERMVRAGLVTRREDPHDQRTRRVGLTDVGRRRLREAVADHRAWVERVMSELSESEQKQLDGLLDRLGTHLTGLLDGGEECSRAQAPAGPRPATPRRDRRAPRPEPPRPASRRRRKST